RAAVLLGNRHPHQPELGQLGDEVVRKPVLPVELRGDGRDLLLGELANGAADELVLGREIEVHAERREASSTISLTPYPVPPRARSIAPVSVARSRTCVAPFSRAYQSASARTSRPSASVFVTSIVLPFAAVRMSPGR